MVQSEAGREAAAGAAASVRRRALLFEMPTDEELAASEEFKPNTCNLNPRRAMEDARVRSAAILIQRALADHIGPDNVVALHSGRVANDREARTLFLDKYFLGVFKS